ncbi:hypothetical protein XMG59_000275 [Marinobacterium sp. xm-g-59]|uniref:DUF3080 family protein n=1 Tax=Marinobacterium sp. xm-g-59 TaxID=2497748 RepID=UPI0015697888|nr:DUF3080 family protein [Marinobacterium sp. xm-g-59]NRP94192.1 hypothetical protein [Marinobacterium sp. xm-g-59]
MKHWLTLLLSTSFIAGCIDTDPAQSLIETYAERTSRAIDIDFDLQLNKTSKLYPILPDRRERTETLRPITEGLIDVLDLKQCGLIDLIAQRNTSLGKLAGGSQRLIYELGFIPKLRSCQKLLTGDSSQTDVLARVQEINQIKSDNWPKQIWNSLYSSPEMEQHFSLGAAPLLPDADYSTSELMLTMQRFAEIAETQNNTDWQTPSFANELERDYETLYRSNFGSEWLASMALLTQVLEQTSEAINQRLNDRPICFNQRQNQKSEILWNVFMKFYVNSLQPYIAQVERTGRQWSNLHQAIIASLNLPQSRWLDTYTHPEGEVWSRYLKARENHTQSWQNILDQCGLRPGNQN